MATIPDKLIADFFFIASGILPWLEGCIEQVVDQANDTAFYRVTFPEETHVQDYHPAEDDAPGDNEPHTWYYLPTGQWLWDNQDRGLYIWKTTPETSFLKGKIFNHLSHPQPDKPYVAYDEPLAYTTITLSDEAKVNLEKIAEHIRHIQVHVDEYGRTHMLPRIKEDT